MSQPHEKDSVAVAVDDAASKLSGLKIVDVSNLQNNPDTGYYDEVEIEDMEFDEAKLAYFYPCPCGDHFLISEEALINGEEIATCPSCSLRIRVIYDPEDFQIDEAPE